MVCTFCWWCWVIASMAVICARMRAVVKIKSTGSSLMRFPTSIASFTPFSVRGTSTQPVKRFFEFHWDSPWRININADSSAIHLASFRILQLAPNYQIDLDLLIRSPNYVYVRWLEILQQTHETNQKFCMKEPRQAESVKAGRSAIGFRYELLHTSWSHHTMPTSTSNRPPIQTSNYST